MKPTQNNQQQNKTLNELDTTKDGLFPALPEESANSASINRRSFLVRNAVIGAGAVMTGRTWTPEARAAQAEKEAGAPKLGASPLSPDWKS